MVGDKISELIISLKNASRVSKDDVLLPKTKLSLSILEVLQKNDFVASYKVDEKKNLISVKLQYDEAGNPAITDVKRVSKLSKRVYKNAKEITPVKNGYGIAVISTPAGVLSDEDARKQKVGGEILFKIW